MREIKLEKRYPHSRTEDITDAFMRGYEQGYKAKEYDRAGDCDNCKYIGLPHRCEGCCRNYADGYVAVQTEPNKSEIPTGSEPQTEREGEINRQDVLTYIDRVANSGMGKKKSLEYIRKYVEKADRKDEPQTEVVNDSPILVKDLVDDEFNPYDEECMRCKHLKLKCEFVPSYCKYEPRDEQSEPQTEVLAQLHEMFANMEKLLRKSSAEIVGAIREQMEKEKSDA